MMNESDELYGIPIYDVIDGIRIISMVDWLDVTYGKNWWREVTYKQSMDDLRAWCAQHGAAYYEAPGDDFDLGAAANAADEEGVDIVVVNDLS
jgi:hypothetical protein